MLRAYRSGILHLTHGERGGCLLNAMPIHRTLKNVVKNHTIAEVKVREATSNDPWGPSTTLMSQIADLTYNRVAFFEVMNMIWRRLNDHGRNWRHVYKSLVLLDYLLKTGSEQVVDRCRENVHQIRTLRDFQHSEDGKDHGLNIRERAKQIVLLLEDDARYKSEREKTLAARERFAQNTGIKVTNHTEISQLPASTANHKPQLTKLRQTAKLKSELEAGRPSSVGEEDLQVQVALAMSREEHEETEKKRQVELYKVQMAVEQSRRALAAAAVLAEEAKLGHGMKSGSPPPRLPPPRSAFLNGKKLPPSLPPSCIVDPWTSVTNPPVSNHMCFAATSSNQYTSDPWSPSPTKTEPVAVNPWPVPDLTFVPAPAAQMDPWGVPAAVGKPEPIYVNLLPWEQNRGLFDESNGFASVEERRGNDFATNALFPSSPSQVKSVQHEDDEFDQLSYRLKHQMNMTGPLKSPGHLARHEAAGELLVGNPWDAPVNQGSAARAAEIQKKKTAEEFLGPNADLVNLKELIAKPPPLAVTMNPFATGSQTRPIVAAPAMSACRPLSAAQPLQSFLPPNQSYPAQPAVMQPPLVIPPGCAVGPMPRTAVDAANFVMWSNASVFQHPPQSLVQPQHPPYPASHNPFL